MMEETGGLQPWQLFTALFVGFWSVSAYFDNLLMTLVFAVSFGVLTEIACKYINGDKLSHSPKKERLNTLVSMAKEEASLVPSLTQLAREETIARRTDLADEEKDTYRTLLSNEKIWQEADKELGQEEELVVEDVQLGVEEEEEEDGGPPPPLPTRDYLKDTEDTMAEVSKRLSQHLEEDLFFTTDHGEDASEEHAEHSAVEDVEQAAREDAEQAAREDADLVSLGDAEQAAREDAELVSVEDAEHVVAEEQDEINNLYAEQNNQLVDSYESHNSDANISQHQHDHAEDHHARRMSDLVERRDLLQEDLNEDDSAEEPYPAFPSERRLVGEAMDEAVEVIGEILEDPTHQDRDEAVETVGEVLEDSEQQQQQGRKFYAPDSSSDEELEEEYANREVNLDESEEEEEEEIMVMQTEVKREALLLEEDPVPRQDINLDDLSPEVAAAAMPTQSSPQHSPAKAIDDDISGMDLTDPSLELAATKIQSVFKGFQTRRRLANRQ